jgi:hypothetical protein
MQKPGLSLFKKKEGAVVEHSRQAAAQPDALEFQ